MRSKLLSFLLISSFVISSVPAFAQEAPTAIPTEISPTIEPQTEALPVVETEVQPLPEILLEVEQPQAVDDTTTNAATSSEEMLEVTLPFEPMALMVTENSVATETATSTPESYVSILIRHGENVAWSGTTTLPIGGTVTATPTGGTGIEIAADSLLAVLLSLDTGSDAFSITDLDYYPSLSSFLVNCISANAFAEACSQWQFVVDGEYSSVGIDKYELEHGDNVYLYFGQPRRVRLSDTEIRVNEAFTATAESYDPSDNSYSPFPNHTVGITIPNSWPQIEVATSTSGADGTAVFSVASPGSYEISLKMPSEWGEFYDYPPTSFSVSSTTNNGPGGGETAPDTGFDISAAHEFLLTGQDEDGSWDSPLVTDWLAIALALSGAPSGMKSALADYLRTEDVDLDNVRDYERHAMALMALNINPYTGGPDDYITPIVDSFDGVQIDDPNIVNDDAFALIVLLNAGYTKDDEIIKKITAFIVSEQKNDGSWDGGIDLSGPYIQALSKVRSLPGVSTALSRAESYLRSEQNDDGGFGDPFATSWAIQGIEALGGSPESWTKGAHTPLTYLAATQGEDGGVMTHPDDYSTRAWATAYAIPAIKGITWDSVLKNFRKPVVAEDDSANDSTDADTSATTTNEAVILPAPLAAETDIATTTGVMPPSQVTTEISAPSLSSEPASVDAGTDQSEGTEPSTESEQEPNPLSASAIESGTWPWVKRLFASLWSAISGLFS